MVLGDKMNILNIGSFVRIETLEPCPFEGQDEAELYGSSLNRIAQVVPHFDDGTSLTNEFGKILVRYAHLSEFGVETVGFYTSASSVRWVKATEELLLLYSDELWQLLAPFGEVQTSPTYHKLRAFLDAQASEAG